MIGGDGVGYMKQVAKMLGVDIGEHFRVTNCVGEFYFTEKGIQQDCISKIQSEVLLLLLYGECKLVKVDEDVKSEYWK